MTTPVGAFVEPPKVTLTVRTLDRAGLPISDLPIEHGGRPTGRAPYATVGIATNVPGIDIVDNVVATEPGVEKIRVVPGVYSLWRVVQWWENAEEDYVEAALFQPQVEVTADTEVVFDARKAQKVEFRVGS